MGYSGDRGVHEKARRRCNATGLAVSWMGNNRLPAPGTAEGALGLPVAPRGEQKGCGGAPWPRVQYGEIEGPLEGPENSKVRKLEGIWLFWKRCSGVDEDSIAVQ